MRKGAQQAGIDPETGEPARLFNPRIDLWLDHFRVEACLIVGITPVGRATAEMLAMNRPLLAAIREEQARLGHPLPR